MSKTINVFLDTSGSMLEMGKSNGAIYAVKSIQDYCDFFNIAVKVHDFHGIVIENIQLMKFNHDIELNSLSNYIQNNNLAGNIIISDGLFNDDSIINDSIAVMIGIDADKLILEKVFQKVFKSENVISAVEYVLYHSGIETMEENSDQDEW